MHAHVRPGMIFAGAGQWRLEFPGR